MTDDTTPTMHIGELADRTGLSLRTIRHYDEVGLLRPSGRTDGGFRLYAATDLERLLVIRRMKPLGFSLDEMRAVLQIVDGLDDPDTTPDRAKALRRELEAFTRSAQDRRDDLEKRLAMADEFIATLRSH